MNVAMLWCAWFTIIGFFQLFTQLCCDRFQYVSYNACISLSYQLLFENIMLKTHFVVFFQLCYSPSTTNLQHGKVVSLVAGIIFSCCALTGLSLYVGQQNDIHVFFFLFCEVIMQQYVLINWQDGLTDQVGLQRVKMIRIQNITIVC